jgi:hypothetical protein
LRGGAVLGTIEVRVRGGMAASGPPAPRPRPATPLSELGAAPVRPRFRETTAAGRARHGHRYLRPGRTLPETAQPGQVLQVRFARADETRLVEAFEALRAVVAAHPGETSVVLHLPAPDGRTQQMQLRTGVAYDAELLAEIHRRIGGVVTLELA